MEKIDVCPMLITTVTIDILPQNILHEFVELSNSTVVQYVEAFMSKYMGSNDKDIQRVIDKLREAYNSYYSYQAFVNSSELAEAFKLIATTNKASISYDMEKSDLMKIRDTCRKVLSYEDRLKRYDDESFKSHINKMKNLAKVTGDDIIIAETEGLIKRIKDLKKVFVNVEGREDDKTILYRIFKFKDKAIQLANTAEGCLNRMDSLTEDSAPFDKRMWRHI